MVNNVEKSCHGYFQRDRFRLAIFNREALCFFELKRKEHKSSEFLRFTI